MLDAYKETQPLVYKLLTQSLELGQYSHAYLIDTNHYSDKMSLVLSFVKALLCPNHYTCFGKCSDCNLCKRIDDGNFGDLEVIYPDGMWIRKEQILNLQKKFASCSMESSMRIYIITEAEKMNAMAANALLKFLEEPEDNILAILMTDNMNQVLPTIISRCRLLSLQPDRLETEIEKYPTIKNKTILKLSLMGLAPSVQFDQVSTIIEFHKYLDIVLNYAIQIPRKRQRLLVDNYNLLLRHIHDKDELERVIDIIILFYKDVLNVKLKRSLEWFECYPMDLKHACRLLSISDCVSKIKVLLDNKPKLRSNVNMNLFMDKLVLELNGGVL